MGNFSFLKSLDKNLYEIIGPDLDSKNRNSIDSEIKLAPVKVAISFNISFLISPNSGAFTAQNCNPLFRYI